MSYRDRDNGNRETDHNRRSSTSSDGNLGGFRVYVGDLGQRISRTDLEREFGQYGPVTDVWMGRKREVSSPNYAFVVYRYPEDAEEAVRDRNGRKVCGRKVRVEHAKPINSNPRKFRGGFVSRGRGDRGNDYRGNQQGRSRERYNSNRRSRSQSPVRNSRGQQSPPASSRQLNDDFNDSPPKKYLKRSPSGSPEPRLKKSKKLRSPSRSPPRQSRLNNDTDSESSSSPPPKKAKKKQKRGHSSSQSPQGSDTRQYQKFQEVPRRGPTSKKKSNYVDNDYSSGDD